MPRVPRLVRLESGLYWQAGGAKAPLSVAHSRSGSVRVTRRELVIVEVEMRRLAGIELGPAWLELPVSRECDHIGGSLALSAASVANPPAGLAVLLDDGRQGWSLADVASRKKRERG